MKKWWLRAGVILGCLWLGAVVLNQFSKPAAPLGVTDGKLAPCPDSPNCVSTQSTQPDKQMEAISFQGPANEAMARIENTLNQMGSIRVATSEDNYLHATATTALLRYIDDVEFYFDAQEQLIHFRSASRIGYSDLGVNRARMERFCELFEQQ